MYRTDVAVIGGGPAGLAVSRCLSLNNIAHVVLERGRIGESWRSARWDSLRLLTPGWLSRLPGMPFADPDPDGFPTAPQLAADLDAYAGALALPVLEGTEVRRVSRAGEGFRLETTGETWAVRGVVIATGPGQAVVPPVAATLPAAVTQVSPAEYRSPAGLPEGGVLVVGASATGVQLASEIQASGRPVTLAAGRHTRMVRRYRGRDIFAWMRDAGVLEDAWTAAPDLAAARRQPSMQLSSDGAVNLAGLSAAGVRVVGRLIGGDSGRLSFGDTLRADCAASDARLERLLDRIDAHAAATGAAPDPAGRQAPRHPEAGAVGLDLAAAGIRSVIWATGYRRDHSWLDLPVFDRAGELRHEGGVVAVPGVFVLGLRFMRRRSSSFLHGIGRDAAVIADAIAAHLCRPSLVA